VLAQDPVDDEDDDASSDVAGDGDGVKAAVKDTNKHHQEERDAVMKGSERHSTPGLEERDAVMSGTQRQDLAPPPPLRVSGGHATVDVKNNVEKGRTF